MKYKIAVALVGVAMLMLGGAGAATAANDNSDNRPVRSAAPAVVVQDIQIPVPGQAPVRAYLVRPQREARSHSLAGVLYLHWLEPPDVTQNRTEFLDEAIQAAQRGAVALLPDLTFPWNFEVFGDQRDVESVRAQFGAVRRAYHVLVDQPGVDPHRTAVVGHDYGAMFGAMLAEREPRIRAEVFMAGAASRVHSLGAYLASPAGPGGLGSEETPPELPPHPIA